MSSLREQFEAWVRDRKPNLFVFELCFEAFKAGRTASGRDELLEACEAALRVSDLWVPPDNVEPEHFDECDTLCKMKSMLEAAIKKARGEV